MPDQKILDDQICPVCKTYFKTCPHTLNDALKEFIKPKNSKSVSPNILLIGELHLQIDKKNEEIEQLKENWTNHLNKWKPYFLDFASRFIYSHSSEITELSNEFANKIIEFGCKEISKDSNKGLWCKYKKGYCESAMEFKDTIAGKDEEIEELKLENKSHQITVNSQDKEINCLKERNEKLHVTMDWSPDKKDKEIIELNKKLEYYLSDCDGVGIICKPNDKIKQVLKYIKANYVQGFLKEIVDILEKKP